MWEKRRAAEMRSNGLKRSIDLQRAWCRWTAQDLVDKGRDGHGGARRPLVPLEEMSHRARTAGVGNIRSARGAEAGAQG